MQCEDCGRTIPSRATADDKERDEWCTPVYGSCALLSGHAGPHHGYPENIAAIVARAAADDRARLAAAWDEGMRWGQLRWATNYGTNGREADNPYRAALCQVCRAHLDTRDAGGHR
jgi:hypothetical protein